MTLETINKYIASLYAGQENRNQYVQETKLKEFIPVVDDDVARLRKSIIQSAGKWEKDCCRSDYKKAGVL